MESLECISHEMFKVSTSLVHARLHMLVRVLNSLLVCYCNLLASEEGRSRFSAVCFEAPGYHTTTVMQRSHFSIHAVVYLLVNFQLVCLPRDAGNAKRGITTQSHPSVRLFVRLSVLVSSKLIIRIINVIIQY